MGKSRSFKFSLLVVLALALVLSGGALELPLQADGGAVPVTIWQIPTADSLPEGIVVDPTSGDIYFAEFAGDKLGRLDSSTNTITEWPVGDGPQYLVADISLGNTSLYFTEGGGNRISRLAPSINGYSSEAVPTPGSFPQGIALTLIGMTLVPSDIWFTERSGGQFGRLTLGGFVFDVVQPRTPTQRTIIPTTLTVTPTTTVVSPIVTATWGSPPLPPPIMMDPGVASGPFTEWPLSLGPGHPGMIAVGPSGDLWISTETASIIQFDPQNNTFIPHNLASGSASVDLVVDSAGYVWFTEGWEDKIGRLDPTTGILTEWPLPSGGQPLNLVLDPGTGVVWFTEREDDRIGALDPTSNTIAEYQLGTGIHPLGIALDLTGPVVAIWFTTERGNSVGRLELATLGPPPTVFGAISLADIMAASLSSAKINGSNNASNQIPIGTILLYQTNEGRYGKLEIVSYGYDLTVKWTTYNPDGSVYSEGDNLVIHGTCSCDLDLGVESSTSSDFWWEQVTAVERYLVPENGARFAVYGAAPPSAPSPSGLPTLSLNIDRGCGANYNPGEPLTILFSVSESASATLFDFETNGNIKQIAVGSMPAGMTRTITGVVGGPAGTETLILVARTLSGIYVSTGCTFGIGGVSPSLISVTLDRGCDALYYYGETATVTLQSSIAGRANLFNITRDGRITQMVANQLIVPGMGLNFNAPVGATTGRSTLVLQVLSTTGQRLTAACSMNVLP